MSNIEEVMAINTPSDYTNYVIEYQSKFLSSLLTFKISTCQVQLTYEFSM